MGVWSSSAGRIRIQITSADIPGAMRLLSEKGILLYDIDYQSDLSALLTIKRKDHKFALSLLHKRGDQCTLADKYGIYWTVFQCKKRYVLISGIIFLLILTVYIPSKILFIQVRGNERIASDYIAEKAMEYGIFFGCDRAKIRSETIKNRILEEVPELDWVGVTTAGCVATIEVKEKEIIDSGVADNFCSIVAATDGIVESVTVVKGKALCVPGTAVQTGQVLISGYEDCGFLIKATGAEGEVYAGTYRRIKAVSPASCSFRGEPRDQKVHYSLQIGKNVINFYKDCSISPTSCVKICLKKYVTLPGGYILPIAIIREETVYYNTFTEYMAEEEFEWLIDAADSYTVNQMIGGEIVRKQSECEIVDDLLLVHGAYACREQIGQYKFEEIPKEYGKND